MEDFGLSAHVRSSHGRAGGEPPSVCRQAGKVIRIRAGTLTTFPTRLCASPRNYVALLELDFDRKFHRARRVPSLRPAFSFSGRPLPQGSTKASAVDVPRA